MEAEKHIVKTERIVRLELQRRELKEAININEHVLNEIDEQLAFTAQLKKDWLHHMRRLEVDRRQVITEETLARGHIDEEMRNETEQLVFLQWLPQLRKLKQQQHDQQARLARSGGRPAKK